MIEELPGVDDGNIPRGQHLPLVYFVRLGDHVKIGYSTNVRQRVRSFSLPVRYIVATLPGGPALESALHTHFAAERLPESEWFRYTLRIHQMIKECRGALAHAIVSTAPRPIVVDPLAADMAAARLQDERKSEEDLLLRAEQIVIGLGYASATRLQSELRIGFARASRIMRSLEERGLIAAPDGSQLRPLMPGYSGMSAPTRGYTD